MGNGKNEQNFPRTVHANPQLTNCTIDQTTKISKKTKREEESDRPLHKDADLRKKEKEKKEKGSYTALSILIQRNR